MSAFISIWFVFVLIIERMYDGWKDLHSTRILTWKIRVREVFFFHGTGWFWFGPTNQSIPWLLFCWIATRTQPSTTINIHALQTYGTINPTRHNPILYQEAYRPTWLTSRTTYPFHFFPALSYIIQPNPITSYPMRCYPIQSNTMNPYLNPNLILIRTRIQSKSHSESQSNRPSNPNPNPIRISIRIPTHSNPNQIQSNRIESNPNPGHTDHHVQPEGGRNPLHRENRGSCPPERNIIPATRRTAKAHRHGERSRRQSRVLHQVRPNGTVRLHRSGRLPREGKQKIQHVFGCLMNEGRQGFRSRLSREWKLSRL